MRPGDESQRVFDDCVDGLRPVGTANRPTDSAWADIPGGSFQQERKFMSRISHFIGSAVHREIVVFSMVGALRFLADPDRRGSAS